MTAQFALRLAELDGTVRPLPARFDSHGEAEWFADGQYPAAPLVLLVSFDIDSGDVRVISVRDAGRWQEVRPA